MNYKAESSNRYAQNEYNTSQLRQLIAQAFSDQELQVFTFDHFRDIHEDFANGMTKAMKISLLIEGCYRRNILHELPSLLDKYRPNYDWQDVIKSKDFSVLDSREKISIHISEINLDDLSERQRESLRFGFRITLASVLNLPIDEIRIQDMKKGSVIFDISLPSYAVTHLLSLKANYLSEQLGIHKIEAPDAKLSMNVEQVEATTKFTSWIFLRTVGVMESTLKQELADIIVGSNHRITFDSFAGQTIIRIWAENASQKRLDEELNGLRNIILDRLGDHIFGTEEDSLERIVFDSLKKSGYSLAIGECYTKQTLSTAMKEVTSVSDIIKTLNSDDWEGLALELDLPPLDRDNLAKWCRTAASTLLKKKQTDISLIIFNNVTQGGAQLIITLASQFGVSATQRSFGGHRDNIHHWALTLGLSHLRRWLIIQDIPSPTFSPKNP